jgi:hypothetical protein
VSVECGVWSESGETEREKGEVREWSVERGGVWRSREC